MDTLKLTNLIEKYQNKFGFETKSYENWHIECVWKFELMKDLGIISVIQEGKPYGTVIKIKPYKHAKFIDEYEKIKWNKRKEGYQDNVFKNEDVNDNDTVDLLKETITI